MDRIKPLLGIGLSVGVLAGVAGAGLGIVSEKLGAALQSAIDGRFHARATHTATPVT